MNEKAVLRKELAKRRDVAAAQADQGRAQADLEIALRETQGVVSFYWPIRSEIDPRPAMEAISKTRPVCLPLTHGRTAPLTFRTWTPDAELTPDGFGVPVPLDGAEIEPSVLVVPMLGFDSQGHRLGYGAGHYDRTLAGLRQKGTVVAIGFAFEAQFCATDLPSEATDEPLDMIITEEKVRRFTKG